MREFSENWRHLKSILTGYTTRDSYPEVYSYEDQRHAKALSLFLMHASLATPTLDRPTVSAILAGSLKWPRSSGASFAGVDISLALLERFGLVSFYAGWCTVHCNNMWNPETVDPSLAPLIDAIEHLKDISTGRDGCIAPHYACSEVDLRARFEEELGDKLPVEQILPELELRDGQFRLSPGNQYLGPLISTHFWLKLRETLHPEEAFLRWMMCMRVNCDRAMPVIFSHLKYPERQRFNEQLLKFVENDNQLSLDVDSYIRQTINQERFSGLLQPVQAHKSESEDEQNRRNASEGVTKPSLDTLDDAYPPKPHNSPCHLEFVMEHRHFRYVGSGDFFYSWLLSTAIDASIRIEGQHLISSGLTEGMVALADSRPLLRYVLFNLLPAYESSGYMVLLLALAETSDVALYYLAKKTFDHSRDGASYIQNLQNGYQQLVCYEYLRSVEDEPDFMPRFLGVLTFLGEQCALSAADFATTFEYRFLSNLLDTLSDQQVTALAQAFAEHPLHIEKVPNRPTAQHYRYMLGFWLIDRLESTGIDPTGDLCRALRNSLQTHYVAEFTENMAGLGSLESNDFFATLPWGKLITDSDPNVLLSLSSETCAWRQALLYEGHGGERPFQKASAMRHYLQVLMGLGRPTPSSPYLNAVAARVQEIARLCGFNPQDRFVQLFSKMPGSDKYDLWEQFCTYSNAFRDDLYEDFVARCVPSIPLDHLFALLERTAIIARANKLNLVIDTRQAPANDALGLTGLEQAFISACESGRIDAAGRLLESAKALLAEPRFANIDNAHTVRVRNVWKSYEYKWQLLALHENHEIDPEKFQQLAHQMVIPHEQNGSTNQQNVRVHYQECEYYRRQIIATAFSEVDPAKCVRLMTALYKETKRDHHAFMLLYGHLKLFVKDKKITRLQHALAYFLSTAGSIEPQQMSEHWIATILEAYRLIGTLEIDAFWRRLSLEQQARLHILRPYCRALIARAEPSAARVIIGRYQVLNSLSLDEIDIEDLVSELAKAEPEAPSMKEMLQMTIEAGQRTTQQLRKHYSQIVSSKFENYIDIVSPDQPPHEFIKDVVLDVANEIVLRKRSLQVASSKRKTGYEIVQENLINDWFTSLFDMRLAEARVGFRDQKRVGYSESGASPGMTDGVFTSAKNTRIAIFEAFRLSRLETRAISKHLDKIAGYDGEALSPVVMVAYCDVEDFPSLGKKYNAFVSARDHTGFSSDRSSSGEMRVLRKSQSIWLATETRRRGGEDIVFYHLLINLFFSPPFKSSKKGGKVESDQDTDQAILGPINVYRDS
jgi:AraC-like DNA-binding protein